jgi:hypothetical protein
VLFLGVKDIPIILTVELFTDHIFDILLFFIFAFYRRKPNS